MSRRRRRPSRVPGLVALLIIAVLVGAAGYAWRYHPEWLPLPRAKPHPAPATTTQHTTTQTHETSRVAGRLYFRRLTESGERLVAVMRALYGDAPARAALEALISGEVPQGCARPLPGGTKLRGVTIKQGTAIADFSEELVSNFQGGSDNEGVVVYAIVNTLNSLPGVEKTQITVEGEKLDTLGGHVEISKPLATDEELVIAR